jgi:hypothetical protein
MEVILEKTVFEKLQKIKKDADLNMRSVVKIILSKSDWDRLKLELHQRNCGDSIVEEMQNCNSIRILGMSVEKEKYTPKHKPQEYIDFMNKNICSFKACNNSAYKEPKRLKMFSIVSQHVRGNCVEECLDGAMEKVEECNT